MQKDWNRCKYLRIIQKKVSTGLVDASKADFEFSDNLLKPGPLMSPKLGSLLKVIINICVAVSSDILGRLSCLILLGNGFRIPKR